MTAELSALEPPPGGWTTDDLDELPESNRHYELIDGALIVSPAPTHIHQTIGWLLPMVLDESCPPECYVTRDVEVRVSRKRSLIPDVVVLTAEAATRDTGKFLPHDVLLAVEIVSPGSVTLDNVTKPALYAQAEIPYYWRVETERRIVVRTHRLDPTAGVYVPTGEFDDVVGADEPWHLEFPISRITPRFFRPQAE